MFTILFVVLLNLSFANEERPGGALTHSDFSKSAFNKTGLSLDVTYQQRFDKGNSFFKRGWPEAPSPLEDEDGLGPTFNAIACASCHALAGRGPGYFNYADHQAFNVNVSLLFRLSNAENYGEQLNPLGIKGVPGEAQAQVVLRFVEGQYPDGTKYQLRVPEFVFSDFSFGAFPPQVKISPRLATQMIGLGLIEAIDEQSILKNEDPTDRDRDGVSGRVQWVDDLQIGKRSLGRFGWKATQPRLIQQNAAAFLGDLGLTTDLFPATNCPPVQLLCIEAPSGGEPEIKFEILKTLTVYTQLLGVPQRRDSQSANVLDGQKAFLEAKCSNCHTPHFRTGRFHEVTFLHDQDIYPYSDFLLHDMGRDLADHRPDEQANGDEWRTPPLWGLGLIPTVNGHQNLLHDARARNVEEAILWHGGEAQQSREAFKNLPKNRRQNLIDFVNSL